MRKRLAVVTGASGGLGSEVCKLLAAQGIELVLLDRNLQKSRSFAAELNRRYPGSVRNTFAVDLADHTDIQRVAAEIGREFSTIDFLFNNAGVLTDTLQFSKYGNEMHFEVNSLAPLQLIDLLRPSLRRAGGATIINTSAGLSLNAKTLDWNELLKPSSFQKLYGPYVNSKQALNVLTAALAPELMEDKIRIRAADPGPNKTRLTKGRGTPLWMRLFYWALPSPEKGAKRIVDPALSSKWGDETGVLIFNGKLEQLPPKLASRDFQSDFLDQCRGRAALTDVSSAVER